MAMGERVCCSEEKSSNGYHFRQMHYDAWALKSKSYIIIHKAGRANENEYSKTKNKPKRTKCCLKSKPKECLAGGRREFADAIKH